ncbi:MAG: type II toxin-antitoxin system RelE/ParE family toxin [Verrucomicrobia bacterium]|nr:type II toxin-antitoxin system RelE/ParE family toxin [Verrucomicrobiota bacterium]
MLKLVHGKYLIFYRVNERTRTVEVLRFQHGARVT